MGDNTQLTADNPANDLTEYTLVGVAPRAVDLLSIRRCAALELTLTCEAERQVPTNERHDRLLSLEEKYACREAWTNRHVDRLLCFEQNVRSLRESVTTPLAILPYCATAGWERLTDDQSLRARLAAIPADLKQLLDDKAEVRKQLARAGVPVPMTLLVPTQDLNHSDLARDVGEPFVVQRRFGSSGHGTYLVQTEDDLERIRLTNPGVSTWVVTAYSGGCTLNIHGLVLRDRVEVSAPSVQLTGISDLASSFGAYCGNDFGAAANLHPSTRIGISRLVRQTGKWLASIGYRGLFGLDVAADAGLHVLEINPRMQGSTWLLGEIELEADNVPMAVAHFAHLLGRAVRRSSSEMPPTAAAQMLLHWRGEQARPMKTSLRSGVYFLDHRDRLEFRRPAAGLIECGEEEILVFGLPTPGRTTMVYPEAVLARVAARALLAEGGGEALTEIGRRIVSSLRAELIPSSDGAPAPVS